MRTIKVGFLCMAAGLLVAPAMRAQSFPVCTGNPLQSFTGTWAFKESGYNFPPTQFLAAAGRFTAAVGVDRAGNPRGVLTITQTTSVDGNPARLETDAGTFQINSDCTGGTLTFNVSSRPDQYDFYFVNASKIVFTSSNSGSILTGSAERVTSLAACAASPLQTFAGTWVFSYEGFQFPPTAFLTASGRFVATVGPRGGVLRITQTASIDGSPARHEFDAGSFQLNADCTGGHLTFNTSSRPIQLDFFFSDPNTIVFAGSNSGDIVVGKAQRFGS